MAIGLARMFNIRFPLNFDSPYQSVSIADFWRRWHITLSAFLRDYVYIPLGGNRRGEPRRLLNLMVTMLLGGLWHGAAWSFVLWGGLHGLYLVAHTLWRRTGLTLPRTVATAITLLAVLIAWVPFRASGLGAGIAIWRGMAGLNGIALPRMVIGWLPPLGAVARPIGSLPYLGDGRTLSFPEVTACLALGWFIGTRPAQSPSLERNLANKRHCRQLRLCRAGDVVRPQHYTLPVFPVLMRKLVLACFASVLLYAVLFGFILDRPLAYGFLQHQIDAKLARAATLHGPKLVILAGSNGPYSHRCETIEPILHMQCINGGVAVGIGLDYLFARWQPLLHPGDVVYLPMEEAQYVRSRVSTEVGPDAAIMFRHDWRTLANLQPGRWAAALFSFDLRFGVMAIIEHALVSARFHDPRAEVTGSMNLWGDHIGHIAALGDPEGVAAHPGHDTAAAVQRGFGAATIAVFIRWSNVNGVRVIGGWSTEPDDSAMPPATRAAIRALYADNGASFLELPNQSLYPRAAFFDTPDHLNEEWQIRHSIAIANALRQMVGQPAVPPLESETSSRRTPAGSETGPDQATRSTCSFCARSQPSTSTATICQAPCPPAIRASASGWSWLQ